MRSAFLILAVALSLNCVMACDYMALSNCAQPNITSLCTEYGTYWECVVAADCTMASEAQVITTLFAGCDHTMMAEEPMEMEEEQSSGSGSGSGEPEMEAPPAPNARLSTEEGNIDMTVTTAKDVRFKLGARTLPLETVQMLLVRVAEDARQQRWRLEQSLKAEIADLKMALEMSTATARDTLKSDLEGQLDTLESTIDSRIDGVVDDVDSVAGDLSDLTLGTVAAHTANIQDNTDLIGDVLACQAMNQVYDGSKCVQRPAENPRLPIGTPMPCNSDNKGMVQAMLNGKALAVCDGTNMVRLNGAEYGSVDFPLVSCADAQSKGLPNKIYYVVGKAHPVNCVNGKEIFSPPFDITGQPVHYYPMDSIDNTARLEDYAGNAFLTAAQKPMTVVPEAQSRVGTSLYFNNDRFLSAGSRINSAIFRKSFTFACWFRGTGSGDKNIFGMGSPGTNNALHLVERGGRPYLGYYARDSGGPVNTADKDVWNHFIFMQDGTKQKTYLNGDLMATTEQANYGGTLNNARLGATTISSLRLQGFLDDVIIFDKALNTEQIDALYNSYPQPPSDGNCATVRSLKWPNGYYDLPALNPTLQTLCLGGKQQLSLPFHSMSTGPPLIHIAFEDDFQDVASNLNPTIVSSSGFSYVDGKNYKAGRFTANTFFQMFNRITPAMIRADYTVAVWVRLPNAARTSLVLGGGVTSARQGLHLGIQSNRVLFGEYSSDIRTGTIHNNKWTHIVYTSYNGLKIAYVNGLEVGRVQQSSYINNSNNIEIGRAPWGTNLVFRGDMDDFMFFNRHITAGDVQLLYSAYEPGDQ